MFGKRKDRRKYADGKVILALVLFKKNADVESWGSKAKGIHLPNGGTNRSTVSPMVGWILKRRYAFYELS